MAGILILLVLAFIFFAPSGPCLYQILRFMKDKRQRIEFLLWF